MTTKIPDRLPGVLYPTTTETTTPTTPSGQTTKAGGIGAPPSLIPETPRGLNTTAPENAGRRSTLNGIGTGSGSGTHRVSTYDALRSQLDNPGDVPPWLASILKKQCDPALSGNAKNVGNSIFNAFDAGLKSPASGRELELRRSIAGASEPHVETAVNRVLDPLYDSWLSDLA